MNYEIEQDTMKKGVWGFWATVGFGVLIILFSFIVQIIVSFFFLVFRLVSESPIEPTETAIFEWLETADLGLLISLSVIFSGVLCIGLILLIIRVRRRFSIADYLGLKSTGIRIILLGLAITLAYIGASVAVNLSLDRTIETDILAEAYTATASPVLFWLAIIVFGPVFEEVMFRGFMFEGFRLSKVGVIGAVILTSLVWAGFHLQYGLFEIVSLFIFGLILGVAKYKTKSLWVPVSMHAFNNLLAVLLLSLEVGV